MLEMAYSLCEWFMQTHGDWDYRHHDFVMPQEQHSTVVANKTEEAKKEEILTIQAQEAALAATYVSAEERKKKAKHAAGLRQKSEAETRYLIDEQLRKVGWEADTENLRYSKGIRPAKGHCMAIAEWPTDSEVGNHGFADYVLFIDLQMVGIIEAKAAHKDIPSVIDYQGKEYPREIRAQDMPYTIGIWGEYKVPFTFVTNRRPYLEQLQTKSGIWFLDLRKSSNAPKALHGWIGPTGIRELLEKDMQDGNRNLKALPYDMLRDRDGLNLREYQLRAIQAAENAIMEGRQKVLLAMATGTGKTRTVLGMTGYNLVLTIERLFSRPEFQEKPITEEERKEMLALTDDILAEILEEENK